MVHLPELWQRFVQLLWRLDLLLLGQQSEEEADLLQSWMLRQRLFQQRLDR